MKTMKPLAILKSFFFDGTATVQQMSAAIAGFKRPLQDDPDYRWLVEESAKQLGVGVEWAAA